MTGEDALVLSKKYTNEVALGQGAVPIPGPPGQNIELQNNGAYVQWRVTGEISWNNLIALSELKGEGEPGNDGETPQFRMSDNTLQYKFPSQDTWTDLFTFPSSAGGGSYEPPEGGIPREHLAQDVQDSLGLADTALQEGDLPDVSEFIKQSDIDASIELHNGDDAAHGINELKEELEQRMPTAPLDGEVHGASGDTWHALDDIAKRAVIMIGEALSVTETEGVITIGQSDFDRLDEFTVDYNGARAVFTKGSPVNVLYGIGEGRAYYKFEFNQPARTITITGMGRLAIIPAPPETGRVFLQSVDGVLQWVTMPPLLAVDKG